MLLYVADEDKFYSHQNKHTTSCFLVYKLGRLNNYLHCSFLHLTLVTFHILLCFISLELTILDTNIGKITFRNPHVEHLYRTMFSSRLHYEQPEQLEDASDLIK